MGRALHGPSVWCRAGLAALASEACIRTMQDARRRTQSKVGFPAATGIIRYCICELVSVLKVS